MLSVAFGRSPSPPLHTQVFLYAIRGGRMQSSSHPTPDSRNGRTRRREASGLRHFPMSSVALLPSHGHGDRSRRVPMNRERGPFDRFMPRLPLSAARVRLRRCTWERLCAGARLGSRVRGEQFSVSAHVTIASGAAKGSVGSVLRNPVRASAVARHLHAGAPYEDARATFDHLPRPRDACVMLPVQRKTTHDVYPVAARKRSMAWGTLASCVISCTSLSIS